MACQTSRLKRRAGLWMGILLCLASTESFPRQCFDEAPSVQNGADPYGSIAPTRLSSEDRKDIERLFQRLEGRWVGRADGYFCRGKKGSVRKEVEAYRIELNAIRDESDQLLLTSDLESSDKKTTRTETLRLILSDSTLRVDQDDRAGEVKILQMPRGGNAIEFLHKGIIHLQTGAVTVKEILRRIDVSSTRLEIDYEVYFVGGLNSASTWKLTRE